MAWGSQGQTIGKDPHGVSVCGHGWLRWQSAPSPEVAEEIWTDLLTWLAESPDLVLTDPTPGDEVLVKRVEHRRVVEERLARVGGAGT